VLSREEPVYGWSNLISNPRYEAEYRPRYYNINDGQAIPIHNKGGHFEPVSGAWIGDPPSTNSWSTDVLTVADPSDHGVHPVRLRGTLYREHHPGEPDEPVDHARVAPRHRCG
jgi:hypothetical protein